MTPQETALAYLFPPYRITTWEELQAALVIPPPGFQKDDMARLARLVRGLEITVAPALAALRPRIRLKAYQLRTTELVRIPRMQVRTTAALALEQNGALFAPYSASLERIAGARELGSFVAGVAGSDEGSALFSDDVRAKLSAYLDPHHLLVRVLATHLRALCKRLIEGGVHDAQRIAALRTLLLAYTAFGLGNEDVLDAVRQGLAEGKESVAFQNVVAELLFCRVPRILYTRLLRPQVPIETFVRRLEKVDLTVYQRNALTSMVRRAVEPENVARRLGAAERAVRIFRIDEGEKTRLLGMLRNLRIELTRARQLYEQFVLEKDLVPLSKVYRPQSYGVRVHFTTQIRSVLYRKDFLDLYPTKDYLDLLKGSISGDCSSGADLARRHLAEPRFFNMRLFRGRKWVGNVYCLDFGDVARALVIDRIQIPRSTQAHYLQFFPLLAKALRRSLRRSTYRYVLVSNVISNHDHIRKLFAAYVRSARPARIELPAPPGLAANFECFRGGKPRFLVLVDMSQAEPS
ncbi:MAG: hypothetical protein QHJ34_02830 [bacterium]|jgi:hypothetical protein|nr:hypothetical protein [candidate division KSB1 bacterium]MDH7559154.1 hypothetical protein [bacterium]